MVKQNEICKISPYAEFLLTEYNNIADAYFNTKNSISTFFKHYLLIVSLPLPLLIIILSKGAEDIDKQIIYYKIYEGLINIAPYISIVISVLGFMVMLYIINLDLTAILYARTVNGIRYYFESRSELSKEELAKIRVLPTDINKPSYIGFHSIEIVVLSFGFIDALYFVIAIKNYLEKKLAYLLIFLVIVFIHYIAYRNFRNFIGRKHRKLTTIF